VTAPRPPAAISVIGIGNDWRADDAAGLLAARRVRELAPSDLDVTEWEGEPVALLDRWADVSLAIVLDAVASGAAPGTVHRVAAHEGPLPAQLRGASTHAFGLAEAVELGRALGRLPERLVVYGIEGESFGAGEEVTGAVAEGVERTAAAVIEEVGLRSSPGPS
jgi:hydrogenase maturation protease